MVKVSSERLPDAQVVLNIEVEGEELARARDRAFQSVSARVRVPGFRPGKAPRHIVERMIGGADALQQETVERAIPDAYRKAVAEVGIVPIDQPEIDVVSVDPLVVKATVSVQPTVTLGGYQSIRLARVPVDVPFERINATIERLRDQKTEWVPVDRPARPGDRLVGAADGYLGAAPTLYDAAGQPILSTEGRQRVLSDRNISVEIDPQRTDPVPGFHEQLVGARAGSTKRFLLSFPADWHIEEQRSKSVLFEVEVREVREPHPPALNDEFARSVGDYATLEALRTDVHERLKAQLEREAVHAHENAVVADATAQATIEIPPTLIRREVDRLIANFSRSLTSQGSSLERYLTAMHQTIDSIREEMRPNAERNLRQFLTLREIGRAEGIEVDGDEIDQEIDRIVLTLGDQADSRRARRSLNRAGDREEIHSTIWQRKVVNLLVAIADGEIPSGTTESSPIDGDAEGANLAESAGSPPPA